MNLRRTGRTTEMLKIARDAAIAGRDVLVLVADRRDMLRFRVMMNETLYANAIPEVIDRHVTFWPYESLLRGELDGRAFDHVLEDHTVAEHRELTWRMARARVTRALEPPWRRRIDAEFVDTTTKDGDTT